MLNTNVTASAADTLARVPYGATKLPVDVVIGSGITATVAMFGRSAPDGAWVPLGTVSASGTTQLDFVRYLRVDVNITAGGGGASTVQVTAPYSAERIGRVDNGYQAIPVGVARPVITGRPEVGETLTVGGSTYTNSPTAIDRQWLRRRLAILGATSSTYVLTAADIDCEISCEETPRNAAGAGRTWRSRGTEGVRGPDSAVIVPPHVNTWNPKNSTALTPPPATPRMHIVGVRGQSNEAGRGGIDALLDLVRTNIWQFCDIPSRTSTYRTFRKNDLPLYHVENRVSENLLSPANYAARVIADTLSPGDILCLVPTAHGGTSLLNTASNSAANAPQWSVGRSLHENFIAQMIAAVEAATATGYIPIVRSVHDLQGEADNTAISGTDYANATVAWINDFRARVPGAANALVILGGFLPERLATLAGLREIEEARKSVAATLTNVKFVRGPSGYRLDDGLDVHYNAAGSRVLGRNMGIADAGVSLPTLITFLSDVSVPEGTGTTTDIQIQLRRSDYGGALSVPVTPTLGTLSPDDFPGSVAPTNLVASFPANSDIGTVTITVNADSAAEAVENMLLAIIPPAGCSLGAKGTLNLIVTNDDAGGTPHYLNASFTGTNGTAVTSYTSESGDTFSGGSYTINNGEIYTTGSGTTLMSCGWVPPNAAYGIRAPFNIVTVSGGQALRWRVQDASNFYWVGVVSGTSTWGVYKTVAGSPSSLGPTTGGVTAGTQPVVVVEHTADHMLTVKIDGVVILGPILEDTFKSGGVGTRQSGSMSATTGIHIMGIETYAL